MIGSGDEILITIDCPEGGFQYGQIRIVHHAIVIVIGITSISEAIQVGISLARIRDVRTIIDRICDSLSVGIPGGCDSRDSHTQGHDQSA